MTTLTSTDYRPRRLQKLPRYADIQVREAVTSPQWSGEAAPTPDRYRGSLPLYGTAAPRAVSASRTMDTYGYGLSQEELKSLLRENLELKAEVSRLRQQQELSEVPGQTVLTYEQAKAAALKMFQERGEVSYSDLMFECGLSIDDVVRIFQDLEEEGLIREKRPCKED